jgi:NTP pyrophosphatase (non-canonical NTP hydrolase)
VIECEDIRSESMHIGEKDFLQYRVNALISQKAELNRRYESLLNEYRELREKLELIEQGQPHPCTYDGKRHVSEYTLRDWLNKLKEEVAEVEVEVNKLGDLSTKDMIHMRDSGEDDKLEHLTEELFDVITVATSKLEWIGWSLWGRLQKQRDVNEKNKRRGYWE